MSKDTVGTVLLVFLCAWPILLIWFASDDEMPDYVPPGGHFGQVPDSDEASNQDSK